MKLDLAACDRGIEPELSGAHSQRTPVVPVGKQRQSSGAYDPSAESTTFSASGIPLHLPRIKRMLVSKKVRLNTVSRADSRDDLVPLWNDDRLARLGTFIQQSVPRVPTFRGQSSLSSYASSQFHFSRICQKDAQTLRYRALHLRRLRQCGQVLADLLIHAFTYGVEFFAGALDDLLVDGESEIHGHSICAHIICVKFRIRSYYSTFR